MKRLPRTMGGRMGMLAAVAMAAFLTWLNACASPLRIDPLEESRHGVVVDDDLELARRYAPFLYKEFHPTKGRQDVPAPVDFDGDLDGENNWEAFARFELFPTVYYAVLETGTHWFLTYHLFHPRDWTAFDIGLHLTHENDGENLQVVVEKASGRVVLLFTQAHYVGGVYAAEGAGFRDGKERVRGALLLVDEDGVPDPDGAHAAVFVECKGHGIYGATDGHSRVVIAEDGSAAFAGSGWVLRPAGADETVAEPALENGAVVPYELQSTTALLWPRLADGTLVGEGRLLDRPFPYEDERVRVEVPRYYEADRFSGPFGPDRGISPFAVDFGFGRGEVGALFFGPAARYAEKLGVPEGWSLEYVDYPFARD